VKSQLEALIEQMVDQGILFSDAVAAFEKQFIRRMLDKNDGNRSKAAKALGIHRNTLSRKVEELALDHNPKRRRRVRR
jgi:DNA-binding NtrC family response regulator